MSPSLVCIILLSNGIFGKTIRFQILTNPNGTRVLKFDQLFSKEDAEFLERDLNLTSNFYSKQIETTTSSLPKIPKRGRSENFAPTIRGVIDQIYNCTSEGSKNCLKDRFTAFITGQFPEERAKMLKHGKKFLKGALLPLLTVLIIKYLLALPVLTVGLMTIKTFWMSLISAGVAAYGPFWGNKKAHVKSFLESPPSVHTPVWGVNPKGEIIQIHPKSSFMK